MVYDFRTHGISQELTLHATHAYIWSLTLDLAKSLCWELSSERGLDELLVWIDSLDPDQHLDAFRACLLVFSVTDGWVVPRQFQLEAGLATYRGKNTIINAGTGSGKTLSMVIPLLMNLEAIAIIISPLKRLQTTQARELERFLIKPLAINQDVELSLAEIKMLTKGAYNAIVVSPEQLFCDPASGAVPKLLKLLQMNRTFLQLIKHVYVDEGHEVFFSGIERHGIPAFRPSYGMLDKFLPKLPNTTTIHVLSATLPPHVIRVIEEKLFGSRERKFIQLPLNRHNIIYTTRTIADINEYKNLSFLVPRHNPDSCPSGVIIFFESTARADNAAGFLNETFRTSHPTCGTSRIAASYHAGLSQTYLTRVFQQFCGTETSGERIDILCATSCGATGIDYPNIRVVIQYGMCPDLCSLIQRAGRAARTPGTKALFIYMVESWVAEKHIDQLSSTYIKDPDTPIQARMVGNSKSKGKGKQLVGMASVAFANSVSCLRIAFAKYLGDNSGDHSYSTRWCCDRHDEKIDFTSFGLGDFWDGEYPQQLQWIFETFGPDGKDRERKGRDRKELVEVLIAWRQKIYDSDSIGFLYDIQDIITEDGIDLVAKISPSRLRRDGPDVITRELEETFEWGSRYAQEVFEQVQKYDYGGLDKVPTYRQQ